MLSPYDKIKVFIRKVFWGSAGYLQGSAGYLVGDIAIIALSSRSRSDFEIELYIEICNRT